MSDFRARDYDNTDERVRIGDFQVGDEWDNGSGSRYVVTKRNDNEIVGKCIDGVENHIARLPKTSFNNERRVVYRPGIDEFPEPVDDEFVWTDDGPQEGETLAQFLERTRGATFTR